MYYNINTLYFSHALYFMYSERFSDQWRLFNILSQWRRFTGKSFGLSRCVVAVTVPDVSKHRRAFTFSLK